MQTYIVDSFTNQAFKGNPAGVCISERNLKENKMLLIAQELGLSETAFVKVLKGNNYSIRYFSPKMEIPLCGHATLAASKVIFEETDLTEICFYNSQNLELHIRKLDTDIIMEFPLYKTLTTDVPPKLMMALGISKVENAEHNKETNILLLEIKDSNQLKEIKPDFPALIKSTDRINGVVITAPSPNDEYDFHSRYFWPWSGTNEDPVTGGTHTFLTPYWSKRLDKLKMKSFQSSKRSGWMEVEILNENQFTIRSQAVIVFKGNLINQKYIND